MKIKRNAQRETLILDQIRDSFSQGDEARNATIHLTDVLTPRKAYWQRVLPIPATDSECLYFLAGRGHEDALGRVAGLLVVREPKTKDGIDYRPDFSLFDVPAEFKTRRANLPEAGEELVVFENYLNQLRGYCALEEKISAVLIVLSLLEGRSGDPLKPTQPVLAVYDVVFTSEELTVEKTELLVTKDRLDLALLIAQASKDPVLSGAHKPLKLCPAWQCGKPSKTVEKKAYCNTCGKEVNHKDGHAHLAAGVVVAEQVSWSYVPRCKWYRLCSPWEVDPTRGER